MKKLIVLLLMLVAFVPCNAIGIDLHEDNFSHHGGARIPASTRLSADYEDGIVTLKITGYIGTVQVYVYDAQGNIVGCTMDSVTNSGVVALNLGLLQNGSYTLFIKLCNTAYYGLFDV